MEIVLITMVVAFGGSMAYFFKQSQYLTQQMLIRTDVATNDFVKQLVDENLQTQKEVKRLSHEVKEFENQIETFTEGQEKIKHDYRKTRDTIQKEVVKIQIMVKERNEFNESVVKDSESIREHIKAIDGALRNHEVLILNATRQNTGQTWHRS
jgi:uncharacterized coiled-coil DUF342 family protein